MVGASLAGLRSGFARLGLSVVDGLDTALFPTLSARSEVIVLDQRTFIEFNEPAGEGPMATFLSRISSAGMSGLSMSPMTCSSWSPRRIHVEWKPTPTSP